MIRIIEYGLSINKNPGKFYSIGKIEIIKTSWVIFFLRILKQTQQHF